MSELITTALVGKTEAGSVEVQPAGDSQPEATNCRWDGSLTPAIPFYELPGQCGFVQFTLNRYNPAVFFPLTPHFWRRGAEKMLRDDGRISHTPGIMMLLQGERDMGELLRFTVF